VTSKMGDCVAIYVGVRVWPSTVRGMCVCGKKLIVQVKCEYMQVWLSENRFDKGCGFMKETVSM
jgi:hypothetical protein